MSNNQNDKYHLQNETIQAASSQLQAIQEVSSVGHIQKIFQEGVTPFNHGIEDAQQIVDKLEELVKFALECEKKDLADGISFANVFKELQEIQKSVELLNQYQKENIEILQALSQREGLTMPSDLSSISEEDKKVTEKLKVLSELCEAAKERIHSEIVQNPDVQKIVTEKIKDATSSDEKKQIRRKNKFKSLGGKQGWMPM